LKRDRIIVLAQMAIFVLSTGCALNRGTMHQDDPSRVQKEFPHSSGSIYKYEPELKRVYKGSGRVTKEDFLDQAPEEGSLWASNGQTNYYFTKNKIRNPGDIVSIALEIDLFKDVGSEIRKTLSKKEKEYEVETLREFYKAKFKSEIKPDAKDANPDAASTTPAATANPPANGDKNPAIRMAPPIETPKTENEADKIVSNISLKDVDLFPSLEFKVGDKMMGEILERYPNGNYKLRTVKRIPYARGSQRTVSLIAVVKGSDIDDETDVVNSGKLYEYRIEVAR
jgi:hypothetical protein